MLQFQGQFGDDLAERTGECPLVGEFPGRGPKFVLSRREAGGELLEGGRCGVLRLRRSGVVVNEVAMVVDNVAA